jgi:hypothetical protein
MGEREQRSKETTSQANKDCLVGLQRGSASLSSERWRKDDRSVTRQRKRERSREGR